MIDCTALHKSFGDHTVLTDASFSVEGGTIAALVGPNGSGKTTTLHVLAGLTTPDAGTASVAGVDVTTDRTAAQEHLAFLPQDVRFHSALTPRQVLRFYAGLRPEPSEEVVSGPRPDRREEVVSGPRENGVSEPPNASTNRIDALLDDVALTDAADRACGTLSGGMRQRLGIAVLELADASVLLLDEPALSLDPEWRSFLMDRLRTRANDGDTVLLATHLLDVWTPIVDRVLHCDEGHIREKEGNPVDAADDVPTASPS